MTAQLFVWGGALIGFGVTTMICNHFNFAVGLIAAGVGSGMVLAGFYS